MLNSSLFGFHLEVVSHLVTSRVVDAESEEPTRKDEHIACELEKLREWFKVCSGCWWVFKFTLSSLGG